MSDEKNEKEQLYRQIASRPPHVVLERMRVHGFWPAGQGLPPDPPEETAERARIAAELADLAKVSVKVKNPDKALAEERKRRWAESKQRRAEAKAKRAADTAVRRAAWDARRAATIVHSGAGVSAGLEHTTCDEARLAAAGLPVLRTPAEVASLLGTTPAKLRWLTYHRKAAAVVHYHRFEIEKKTGGARLISAPKPALADAQQKVLDLIVSRMPSEPAAHGFVAGRSIVTNAGPHSRRAVVVNLDLKDFFPSVVWRRVKGLFVQAGYSEQVSTVLALLCTEPPRTAAVVGGKVWHVALGERVLPQGACTSPALTNRLCRRLDRRLTGLAAKGGWTYTRYADDLTFSGDDNDAVGRLLGTVRRVLAEEGFTENPAKTRIMRRGGRQEVTGLTVNDRPAVSREEVRRLRAILHNAARSGLESQNRDRRPDFAAYLRGKVEFVSMVDPARGAELREMLELARRSTVSPYRTVLDPAVAAAREAAGMLREELRRAGGPRGDGDKPAVDAEVGRFLLGRLTAVLPARFVGRETGVHEPDGPGATGLPAGRHVWVVNPNDGTGAYLAGRRGGSVSIALLRDGLPVLGVVAAHDWPDDAGTVIAWAESCGPVSRDGRPARRARTRDAGEPEVILVPSAAESVIEAEALAIAPRRLVPVEGAALRFALVAAGEAHGASCPGGPGPWEIAGGLALLRGAGLVMLDSDGRPVALPADGTGGVGRVFGGDERIAAALAGRHRGPGLPPAGPAPARVSPFPPIRPGRTARIHDPGVLARAQGCLLGQLAGDALGGLVEFDTADSIRRRHPRGVRRLVDGGHWRNLAGQPTDDSEMALMLARTLVRDGRWEPASALAGYVQWYRSRPFDIGGTTSAALGAASAAGAGPEAVAAVGRSAGRSSQANGSLMRISPLGIFAAGRPASAGDLARADSALTHPHAVCGDSCAVFAAAIAHTVARGDGPRPAYEAACAEAVRINAVEPVRRALDDARTGPPDDYQSQMGWVLVALRNAFWQLLHARSAEAGIVDTVHRGGDTDTNGAIAGALLGAVHGRDALPVQWRTAVLGCRPMPAPGVVHPRPPEFWPVDALILAEALLVAGGPGHH